MISLALVMPQSIYRIGLLSVLGSITGLGFVWVTADIDDLLHKLDTLKADVILLDLEVPNLESFQICYELKKVYPSTSVGVFVTKPTITELKDSKAYQVDLSLPRHIDLQVLEAKLYSIVGVNRSRYTRHAKELMKIGSPFNLKARDFELLSLLKRGMTSKQISLALNLSKRAIDSRRDVLLKKMDAKNCIEAVHLADQLGII